MAEQVILAADLGASSGRLVAGRFDGRRLRTEEVHRFANGPVVVQGRWYWDLLALWSGLEEGLRAAAARYADAVRSVGVDTWGVDFALLGRGDELLGNPRHYRDPHTDGILQRAFARVAREEIFAHTGLQFMQFNTLYQLLALAEARSPLLEAAESLLMMPDLFHWLLSGEKGNEATNASTTQCYDPRRGGWSDELLARFELPRRIFGPLLPPGTRLGRLAPAVAQAVGLAGAEVVLPGTHDTASAVLAVPARAAAAAGPPDWCYISSGTWSLMGVELGQPRIDERCQALNFTNEGGVGGTTRLLKNIAGLWLVQECRRHWAQAGRPHDWDALVALAEGAPPLAALVEPDDPSFLAPTDMPAAIRAFCRRTGQPEPSDEGAIIRCALESLALKCRRVLGWLEELTGRPLATVHVVGGGSQNRTLCQFTADACGRRVVAGPAEATAIGNLIMQAIALGQLGSIAEGRELVARSEAPREYEPRDASRWNEAYQRFLAIGARAAHSGPN